MPLCKLVEELKEDRTGPKKRRSDSNTIFTSQSNFTPCVTFCLLEHPKKAILLLLDTCNKESNKAMTDETKRTKANAIEIFYSYAHKDEAMRRKLENHLAALHQQGLIASWHDRMIEAGTEWEQQIDDHLNRAHIILLLISASFLASPYCSSIEMKRAMERHAAKEARVIPIILRPVHWQDVPFAKLQMLPTEGKPVASARWHNQD